MKAIHKVSKSLLFCLITSNCVLGLASSGSTKVVHDPPTARLCRVMCGRPLAFRQGSISDFGLCPVAGAQPRVFAILNGSERFRTSGGKAEQSSVELLTGTGTTQTDPSVEQFWEKFKAAVQKSDKTAVAAMSQFPVGMPYGYPKIRTGTQLTRRWRVLFNVQANAAKCFEDAKPVVDSASPNRFTVGCRNEAGDEVVVYGFVRTRNGWKLTYLDNINE